MPQINMLFSVNLGVLTIIFLTPIVPVVVLLLVKWKWYSEDGGIYRLDEEFTSTLNIYRTGLVPTIESIDEVFRYTGRSYADIRYLKAGGCCNCTKDLRLITDFVKKLPNCVYVSLVHAYIDHKDPVVQTCIRELLALGNVVVDLRKTAFTAFDAGPFIQSLDDNELERLLFIPNKILSKQGWYIVVGDFKNREACMHRVQIIRHYHLQNRKKL